MRDAQGRKEGEALSATIILGKHKVDMDVGECRLRIGRGADVEHAIAVLPREMVERLGPLGGVPRDSKHCPKLVHLT